MEADVDKVRWGILSTANIALEKVIPGLRRSALGEVKAIASRTEGNARAAAERLAIPRWHGSYEGLLADDEVDAVYIPLPNHLHAEWAVRALGAGKHVLCEKPLALTVADAERMFEASDAADRLLMEAFMYRHHPSWIALREAVVSGRLGRLAAVDSWFSYFNDDATNIRNVLAFGGGALYDIGCYSINLSRMLFGAEPLDVSATVVRDPTTGVDVLVSGTLAFADGVASFTCATRVETDQRVHVYGTRARATIEIPFNIPPTLPTRVSITAGGDPPVSPDTETMVFPPADPYACEADAFASAIIENRPAPVPPQDAIGNLRVIERLFAAGGRGAASW
jgi:predicted dehydrogenase